MLRCVVLLFFSFFLFPRTNAHDPTQNVITVYIGVGVYVANIVKGLRMVSADYWDSDEFRAAARARDEAASSGADLAGEVVLGRADSLKVLSASNTILALVLVGILVLQAGQWYAERKDSEEADKVDRAEKEKEKSSKKKQ